MTQYAKRRDGNQNAIAAILEQCGVTVKDTSRLGGGYPDLTCPKCQHEATPIRIWRGFLCVCLYCGFIWQRQTA